jgi:MFS transporter, FSR family, fosmidomycin resistance protein
MRTSSPVKLAAASGTTVVAVVTLSHFVNDNFTSLLTPLAPAIAAQFDAGVGEMGTLVALLSFVGSVSQPLFGVLGDRFDRRYLAAAGPVLAALGMTLMGYAPNFGILALLIVLGGIGSAVFHPSGAAYVAANSAIKKRGLYASIFSAGGTAGLALGPLTATALGLQGIIWLMPIGLLMGVISFVMTPSSRPQNTKKVALRDYLEVFSGHIRSLWIMSVLRSLSTVTYASLIPFAFANKESPLVIAWTLAVFSLASAIGGIVGGQISDRVGRVRVLRSSVAALIPTFVLLVFVTPSSIGLAPFLLLAFVVGALANATIPVAVVAAQEYAPGKTAMTSAIMMGFSWGTSGVLYKLVAEFAEVTSIITAMLVTIAMLLPAWWIALRLPEPERAKLT